MMEAAATPLKPHGAPLQSVAEGRSVRFQADDGFPLCGTMFEGSGAGPLVLISSATAVPQGYYSRFASHLVASGARAVLTYDYRGTGKSPRPPGYRRRIDYKDWALRDFPAAVVALDEAVRDWGMVGVGHSYGGQALGLSGVSERFSRYATVATMSGYWRLLDDRAVWPRMNMIGVPVSFFFDDVPRWMGLGDPIPSSCFRDWARWCRMKNYFFDDPTVPQTARFEEVRTPLLALGFTDDPWATPRAMSDFMARYRNAPVEQRWIEPGSGEADRIGHLGFFRSRFAATLWPSLTKWLLAGGQVAVGDENRA